MRKFLLVMILAGLGAATLGCRGEAKVDGDGAKVEIDKK